VVLTAEAPRSALLFHSDARGEQEVVAFDVRGWRVDGDEEDWMEGFARRQEANRTIQEGVIGANIADPSLILYP
jgi:hypothetical protein